MGIMTEECHLSENWRGKEGKRWRKEKGEIRRSVRKLLGKIDMPTILIMVTFWGISICQNLSNYIVLIVQFAVSIMPQ